MGRLMQFRLLLWKNYLVQRRQVIWTLLELLLPALFTLALLLLRQSTSIVAEPVTEYEAFSVEGTWRDVVQPLDGRMIVDCSCFKPMVKRCCGGNVDSSPTQLYFTPNTSLTRSLMHKVSQRFSASHIDEALNCTWEFLLATKAFADETSMTQDLIQKFNVYPSCRNPYLGGIVFDADFANGNDPQTIRYAIRLANMERNIPPTHITEQNKHNHPVTRDGGWDTKSSFPLFQSQGPRDANYSSGGDPGYWTEGFLSLQKAIDSALMEMVLSNTTPGVHFNSGVNETEVKLSRFSYPSYILNTFIGVNQQYLPLLLILSFLLTVLYISRNVVQEKQDRLKYMRVMGLSNWLHWVSHFLVNFLKLLVAVSLITLLLCVEIREKKILDHSSPSLVLLFLLLYSAATISFAFAVSVFFKKGNSAAACAGIVWFVLCLPFWILQPKYETLSLGVKLSGCLFLNSAMGFGLQVINIFEGQGVGLQWSTFTTPGTVDDDFTMAHVFCMILIDIAMCITITWYVEGVYPGDEGIPKKPWFPFLPSYWCPSLLSKNRVVDSSENVDDLPSTLSLTYRHFESPPLDITPQISVRGLTKVFGRGRRRVTAVKELNIEMYSGQVTALLGHNGAGKSTTISMLTGLIPATSGRVMINNLDMASQLERVRKRIGLCPQYNVLFDNLTVMEHLYLFCKLKGRDMEEKEVEYLLKLLGLDFKRHSLAKTLSGGMKRKLSVAIALIGGSEVIFLDEPTSGMDPGARHEAWSLLQAEKKNRTIILTTHFMEEADVLGDRIAIMAGGQLQCCGSALFLKSKYGGGHRISVVFEKPSKAKFSWTDPSEAKRSLSLGVLRLLRRHCPRVEPTEEVGLQATYQLPDIGKEKFQSLFSELEARQGSLGISSFGISLTSMEEVFLKVGRLADISDSMDKNAALIFPSTGGTEGSGSSKSWMGLDTLSTTCQSATESSASTSNQSSSTAESRMSSEIVHHPATRNTGVALFWQQFYATFIKRVIHSCRNWLVFIAQIVIPVVSVLLGVALYKTTPGPTDMPALPLTLAPFHDNYLPILNSGNDLLTQSYKRLFDGDSQTQLLTVGSGQTMSSFIQDKYRSLGVSTVNRGYIVGVEMGEGVATAFFNNQPYHSPAITLSLVDNAIFTHLQSSLNLNTSLRRILTLNHPLPPSKADTIKDLYDVGYAELMVSLCLIFGLAFLSSSFVVFLIRERETKARHLQLLSGLSPSTYWLATFAWDYINFMIPVCLVLVLFVAGDIAPLIDEGRWVITLLLLCLYAWAILPMMYVASHLFKSAVGAFVKLTIFNIISGCLTLIVTGMMYVLNQERAEEVLEWVFLVLFPNYTLAQGINIMYMNAVIKTACVPFAQYCSTEISSQVQCCFNDWYTDKTMRWENPGIGRMPFFLLIQGVSFWIILVFIETKLFRHLQYLFQRKTPLQTHKDSKSLTQAFYYNDLAPKSVGGVDVDVSAEKERVSRLSHWDGVLLVRDLTKYYGSLKAVKGVDFVVRAGECFGLLGTNGAGKTSTFQMLTGENHISDGSATICGVDVHKDWKKAGKSVGYCPQFDAVIGEMTGRESLWLFARLRGVPRKHIPALANATLHSVGIDRYADKQAKTYSGGNKRRLSLGVALIGNPPLLLLDEPTTGVDPAARRAIWHILARIRHQGTALVLTSHSMDECEALCTRLGIMVAGSMKCLGSTQHLKEKYGVGYNLQIKVGNPDDVPYAIDIIQQVFPWSQLKEVHHCQLSYELAKIDGVTWSQLFGVLEKLVSPLNIVDYALSQTTLESVFLRFSEEVYGQSTGTLNAQPPPPSTDILPSDSISYIL